jgi:hypothetical protein
MMQHDKKGGALEMAAGHEGTGKGAVASSSAAAHYKAETAVWDSKKKQIIGGPMDGMAAETGEEAAALIAKHYGE